jgi:hypothetical protein
MALVALAMVAIVAMAALSIDIGTLYQASAEAQRAADAGALAAARVISLSGITGDPTNGPTDGSWSATCGGLSSAATLAATSVAQQNLIGGAHASTINVYYGTSSGASTNPDCTGAGAAFGVNPVVTVYVQQAKLPTFFARVFSLIPGGTPSTSGVSATAVAEVFNPSNSGSYATGGEVVPVQPRCVKPWIVPNKDPLNAPGCSPATCNNFVSTSAVPPQGSILNGGITYNGKAGVIGESFYLVPDCSAAGTCNSAEPFASPPQANSVTPPTLPLPNLQYLPGQVLGSPVAVPSCGTTNPYQEAIAGCDQSTPYQCGVSAASATQPSLVNLNENPSGAGGDTSTSAQCLINQANVQDSLNTGVYPYQILAGKGNPLNVSGSAITSSSSIVSLPIYDGLALATGTQQPAVTIVGFLQVFINSVDATGNLNVTVMNVAGCGNAVPSGATPVTGTSPVPVRLITPP